VTFTLDEDGFRHPLEVPFHSNGDGDRRLTPPNGCEGESREDRDCDGVLDIDEDEYWCIHRGPSDYRCNNGRLDSSEDADRDGKLDTSEDRNGNGRLDDTPFPTSVYPYGRLRPVPRDRDYAVNQISGVVNGPYFKVLSDNRRRFSLRQDLGIFVPDYYGAHDFKVGYLLERERFDRTTDGRDIIGLKDPGYLTGSIVDQLLQPELDWRCNPYEAACLDPGVGRIVALLPTERTLDQSAEGSSIGLYVQDTYKPRPNISIGLGVRFDREAADTSGYTFFDPQAERREYDRLLAVAGRERTSSDLLAGNGDGVRSHGLTSDPIALSESGAVRPQFAKVIDRLQAVAVGRLTRHRGSFDATLSELEDLFPELFSDGEIDEDELAALSLKGQQPEHFRVTNNNLAPRLSFSWDPWSDGRTKLFATWGRYYDKLFLNSVVGEQDIERIARYYVFDRSGIGALLRNERVISDGVPTHNIGATLSRSPPSVTQVDRNLRTPFSDELTIGFERELAPEVALSIRYIDRKFRDQLQDVDINHQLRFDPTTGEPSDLLGNLTKVERFSGDTDPLALPTPDGRPDLFINNFFFNQVLRVGNFNESRYKAFEIELAKRLSRRWQLQGSYTYSRALGDAEDFQSRLGNDPSTVESEYGPLDFDQRHVIKLSASTFLPRDWQLGVAASWSSGLPYSVISRFFAADNVDYQQFRTRFGFTDVVLNEEEEPVRTFRTLSRNSERNHPVYDFNVRAKKSFVIGRTSAALFIEVFNLLNSDDLRVVSFQPNPGGSGLGEGEVGTAGTHLQLDATRRFGRRYQIGFQFSF
jgi:hypothetical protein